MVWAKVDDRFPHHPKVVGLDPAAVGIWLLCLCDARARGDATVPAKLPERYAPGRGDELGGALEACGLWERTAAGWLIHDSATYLPPVDLSAKRSQAGSKGAESRWQTDGKPMANPRQKDGSGYPVPVPVPETVHVGPAGPPSLALTPGVLSRTVQDQEPEASSTQAKPESQNGRNPIRGEIVQGVTAGQLVGEFVLACTEIGVEPIPRDKARIGKDCKELLAAGKAAELISAAIARLVARGRPVSALIGIVGEIERERAGHPVSNGRVNTTGGSARLERAVEAVKAERRQGA